MITLNLTDHHFGGGIKDIQNEYEAKPSHVTQINNSIVIEEDRLKETQADTPQDSRKVIEVKSNSSFHQEVIQQGLDNQNHSIEDSITTDNAEDMNVDLVIHHDHNNSSTDTIKSFRSDVVDSFDSEITDTDSGVYSLYETVLGSSVAPDPDQPRYHTNSPVIEPDKKFLTDAFYEARSLKKLLDSFCGKFGQDLAQSIRDRQDSLRKYLTKLELEKVENNESINSLKHRLFQQSTSHMFLTKFQLLIDQIDQITSLIFGIEMKIEKCSYNEFNVIDTEYWSARLTEAVAIKARHSDSLINLIRDNLSAENQSELQEKICLKQRQICQLKLIKAEIYCNEMQLKILFM